MNIPSTVMRSALSLIILITRLHYANAQTRIINGTDANGFIPYQALIRYTQNLAEPSQVTTCGGALIAEDVVLTAAHCFASEDVLFTYSIYLGAYDRSMLSTDANVETYRVKEYAIHPDYDSTLFDYDAMLIRLDRSVANYDPIDIALDEVVAGFVSRTTMVQISGWGLTSYPVGSSANKLQVGEVPYLSNEECNAAYSSASGIPNIDEWEICSDTSNYVDACVGDSGGPMVYTEGDTPMLVGLVSWSADCGNPLYPGVYVRVSYIRDWIETITCLLWTSSSDFCQNTSVSLHPTQSSMPTSIPSSLGPTLTRDCVDYPDYQDILQRNCAYYEANEEEGCEASNLVCFGYFFGYVPPGEACCWCGGGISENPTNDCDQPSDSPTLSPSPIVPGPTPIIIETVPPMFTPVQTQSPVASTPSPVIVETVPPMFTPVETQTSTAPTFITTAPSISRSTKPSTRRTVRPSTLSSAIPTATPSIYAKLSPSTNPTEIPSRDPSYHPTLRPTLHPTLIPSTIPTSQPTLKSTNIPTIQPSTIPTIYRSINPTTLDTFHPSSMPTVSSSNRSASPSMQSVISTSPSVIPTSGPSTRPTNNPSILLSSEPSMTPSIDASFIPSKNPIVHPSVGPSFSPLSQPVTQTSFIPSVSATTKPMIMSSSDPTTISSTYVTEEPSTRETKIPSRDPTRIPSLSPTSQSTFISTTTPTSYQSTDPTSFKIGDSSRPSSIPTGSPSSSRTAVPTEFLSQSNPSSSSSNKFVFSLALAVISALTPIFYLILWG